MTLIDSLRRLRAAGGRSDQLRHERSFAVELEDEMMRRTLGYGLDEAARREIEAGAERLPRPDTS